MKIIFILRQSLDIFGTLEYNFNGNQDKKSHRYSEGRAFILKSIDPKFSTRLKKQTVCTQRDITTEYNARLWKYIL